MFIRYRKNNNGLSIPIARIYDKSEHHLDMHDIDYDAVWAIKKLKQTGAQAFIVGGAVRDLLLGSKPKDFDIATSASPRQVQRLFWNARVIGRRFKLVHLTFRDKIIEVSTFRSGLEASEHGPSMYGTIEQDAKRRDFTINSLYLDPIENLIYDFNDSMEDFKKCRIRSILPLSNTFIEDPVRMIRAIKYAETTSFALGWDLKRAIRSHAEELEKVPTSRITEEVTKILASGESLSIIRALQKYGLLVHILPCLSMYARYPAFEHSLRLLDEAVRDSKKANRDLAKGQMFKALAKPVIVLQEQDELTAEERFRDVFRQIKVLISPITPANYDIEEAASMILREAGFTVPKQCLKAHKPLPSISQRRKPQTEQGRNKPRRKVRSRAVQEVEKTEQSAMG